MSNYQYVPTPSPETYQDQINELDKNFEEAKNLIKEYVDYIRSDCMNIYNQGIFNRMRDFLKRVEKKDVES